MPINFAVKLAATIAIEALQVGLQATRRTEGPRLDELTVTVADFGTPLPRFLGERKFACPVFHAEDLKEVEHSTKVKGGGKQTTYSYLATFACAIADNEIDKVLKIFFDDKLVYDATGTGPISYASSLGIDLNAVMRIYYGTETQDPDPRYTSWCEDKYGANSAPAYRGLSYLFFEELPVDNFGNRIPQISVIAVSAASAAYPSETATSALQCDELFIDPSGQWAVVWNRSTNGGQIEWWDAATRTKLGTSDSAGFFAAGTFCTDPGFASDGTAYFCGLKAVGAGTDTYFATVPPLGTPTLTLVAGDPAPLGRTIVLEPASGAVVYSTLGTTGYISGSTLIAHSQSLRDACLDSGDNVITLFQPDGSSANFTIECPNGPFTVTGAVTRSDVSTAEICVTSTGDYFVISDGRWYLVSSADGSLIDSGAWAYSWTALSQNNAEQTPGISAVWVTTSSPSTYKQISLADASVLQSFATSSWTNAATAHWTYDRVSDAIWGRDASGTTMKIAYLNRASNAGTTLGAIVSKMCADAGLTDRDTSLLTQAVKGYSWTRGDVKSQMEPALDIHDVDACPHDFTIKFLPRGTTPSGTIATADLAKNGDGARYKITLVQDTDLPILLRVNFADTGFDQQTNNVLSPLPADSVDSQRDATIDLTTYAATPDEAQQLADRYIRRQWNSREAIETSLTSQKLALEPGDTTTLSLDGITQNVRLTKQTFAGGRIDCTFVRDETSFAAVNSSTTGPDMDARTPEVITIPAPIKGFVIDAPYRYDTDADVRPLLYSGAGAYGGLTFPGAAIYEATGSPAVYDTLFATVSTGATWGLCSGTLSDVPSPWLWDRGNTLTVSLQSGSLTPCTEADIDADPTLNLILVGSNANGWEYVNFTTATLNGDGSYTLSGFKRGRRGTEWAVSGHGTDEAWILASSLDVDEMGADEIGGSLSFKAQAIGRPLDSAAAIDVTYAGNTLNPYAPARIKWTTDGTDMFGEIIRRTRVGGSWVGGSTIPLSENSEDYEVDILSGATVLRTITVTGTNTFTYTGAQIAADGGTVGVAPSYNAYQMSDVAGRGFALAA